MRKSKIFGNKELELLEARIKGSHKDPTGVFNRLVKPKVTELLEWFDRRHELKRALRGKRK